MTATLLSLPTRRSTIRLAQAIARHLAAGDLVVLDGALGAGKTFLVRAALRAIGVPEEVAVPSPSFTLMNEYASSLGARVPVVHADLYRLLGAPGADEEIAELGLRPRRADGWALLVEWGGDHFGALGGDGVRLRIDTNVSSASSTQVPSSPQKARVAHVEGIGPRGTAFADRIVATVAASSSRRAF